MERYIIKIIKISFRIHYPSFSAVSSCYLPTVGKNIALGYVPAALATIGSTFAVEIRGQAIAAVVVKTPFYKRAR